MAGRKDAPADRLHARQAATTAGTPLWVQKMLMDRIQILQQHLAYYEQIKRITLLAHHFSMESGELTNTLKIRRPIINKNYKAEIDKMYEE